MFHFGLNVPIFLLYSVFRHYRHRLHITCIRANINLIVPYHPAVHLRVDIPAYGVIFHSDTTRLKSFKSAIFEKRLPLSRRAYPAFVFLRRQTSRSAYNHRSLYRRNPLTSACKILRVRPRKTTRQIFFNRLFHSSHLRIHPTKNEKLISAAQSRKVPAFSAPIPNFPSIHPDETQPSPTAF